ncbi:LysM peptidoglycan-binding domain-containing protein [Pseudoduganella sp. HUAS MS19]
MTRFIKASYNAKLKIAQFITDDNRVLIRSGGSLQWRISNAGDLASPIKDGKPAPRKTKNFIGFAKPEKSRLHFFIFPDYETGRAELKASLQRKHIRKTIKEMVYDFAPPSDGNDTEKYIRDLCNETGFNKEFRLDHMDEKQFARLMDGIEKLEGYHKDKDTRKEVWFPITQIQAGNGTQPVQGEQIIVRSEGKESTYTSNAAGLFPPIVHGKKPAEILHKTADGNLKKLADLHPEKGLRFTLINKLAEFFGTTAPVKAPENPVSKSEGFLYEVKPKDTLGHIAAKFKDRNVTVQRLKQDNQLKTDTIHPGQILGINMPPPGTTPPKTEKKAPLPGPAPKVNPETAASPTSTPTKPSASTKPNQKAKDESFTLPAAKTPPLEETAPKKQVNASNREKSTFTAKRTDPNPTPPIANTTLARSKEGKGEPLALIAPESGTVPWMKYALAEAKRFKGATEGEIQKERNYHKIVKTNQVNMTADTEAWCAAFANWCLMRAGFPIRNPSEQGYTDQGPDTSRANGFRVVHMKQKIVEDGHEITTKNRKPKFKIIEVTNPMYTKIDTPVYGAIAIISNPGGYGTHVGFVYGRSAKNRICVLGGNQAQQINFSPFHEKEEIEQENAVGIDGKQYVKRKKTKHLAFYMPTIYMETYQKSPKELPEVDPDAVNKEFDIKINKKSKNSTR